MAAQPGQDRILARHVTVVLSADVSDDAAGIGDDINMEVDSLQIVSNPTELTTFPAGAASKHTQVADVAWDVTMQNGQTAGGAMILSKRQSLYSQNGSAQPQYTLSVAGNQPGVGNFEYKLSKGTLGACTYKQGTGDTALTGEIKMTFHQFD